MIPGAVPLYVLVRLKAAAPVVWAAGRKLRHHGPFGNLHAVPPAVALRLIDGGEAKLLAHMSLPLLRRQVERSCSA